MSGPARAGLPAVLAVDGGNSKTDVALVGADGSLLAAARGAGMDAQRDGVTQTAANLAVLVSQVAVQAAAGHGRAPRMPLAAHLSACIANADLPEEEEEVSAALRAQGWSLTTAVVNDTFAVLRAGARYGVAVTCGAGINCVGVAADGRSTRFLALGDISGDWGGGYGLGLAALRRAMRAEDGRGPATALARAVPAHFGLATVTQVAVGVHKNAISLAGVSGLGPVVLAVAQEGDPVACGLVRRQAEEICLMAVTAMRRLSLTGPGTPVVLGGGLITARHPLLIGGIEQGLARQAPHAEPRIIDVPPVAGAALLGLDRVGAGAAAQARLRAAYAAAPGPARHAARVR